MKTITRKSVVEKELEECFAKYVTFGLDGFVTEFKGRLLNYKVKFPLLEYCGATIYEKLPNKNHLLFCDKIEVYKTEGGNVVIGIILQHRLCDHFKESVQKAVEYITRGDEWYVSDIIGERAWGWALLNHSEKTLEVFKELINHENTWVVRSLGAGTHNAIKNELDKSVVKALFSILLSRSDTTDHQIKRGIGWAAKTTARFHPDIIQGYEEEIYNSRTGRWFQNKVEMGLKKNKYAERN